MSAPAFNPNAKPGDVDYRPGPDWPPSLDEITAVFGPSWVRESLDFYRERLQQSESVVLALRRMLIEFDPSLPDEYDGAAWQAIEGVYA